MKRTIFSSGAKWEEVVGYSRAVRVGNVIEVSGTVAIDDKQNLIGEGDPYLQTKFILHKIEAVLKEAGADLNNIIRTRMYVTDINNWEEIGRAHGEAFEKIKPCTTMVEISKLISPGLLIEIEATAMLSDLES